MHILAVPVSNEQLEMSDDEALDSYFVSSEGNLFNYKYEVNTDGEVDGFVRFSDTLGRMVPVDFDDIVDIAEMWGRLARFVMDRKQAYAERINALQTQETWLQDEIRDKITG